MSASAIFPRFNSTTKARTIAHNCTDLIRSCKQLPNLLQTHARLIVIGLVPCLNDLSLHLINSYSCLQKPDFALSVFNSITNPDLIQCNSMLRCYTRNGKHSEAIQLYDGILRRGLQPDNYTFTFVVKACAGAFDSETGIKVHRDIVEGGLIGDVFIGTGLVDMYAKHGMIRTARELFEDMPRSDVVTWNVIIAGFSQNSYPYEALGLFRKMQSVNLEPGFVTILNLFPAVCELAALLLCQAIHGFVIRRWLFDEVSNGLIDTYSKCGRPDTAHQIFDGMSDARNDVSWATMISGYVYNGMFEEALQLFDRLRRENVKVNQVSIVSALSAAAEIGDLEQGIDIHGHIIEQQIHCDVTTKTMLVTMYAKCGEVEKAKSIFDEMPERDIVAWSAMVSAMTQSDRSTEAISLFKGMQSVGVKPNVVTIVSLLPACADLVNLKLGKTLHGYILRYNINLEDFVGTALVAMYAQLGDFASAHVIFDSLHHKSVITWNAMISGYTQSGDADDALWMFHQLTTTGEHPDHGTMVGVLPACALLNALDSGECIHGMVIKHGFGSDVHVRNALIDMYLKCGDISSSEYLFSMNKPHGDAVCWNTMIAGYMHNGYAKEATLTFLQMRATNVKPNLVTIISILPATAYMAYLKGGQALHSFAVKTGFESFLEVGNTLIDMYFKCGRMDLARNIFEGMLYKDVVSWNAMLTGYGIHGHAENAVALFTQMKNSSIRADSVSFLSALSACRHGGLVAEGRRIFTSMGSEHHPEPNLEHYACMVDMLGRAGHLDEAWDWIQSMPMEPDVAVWGALLGGCRTHSNVKLAEIAADQLIKLDPGNPAHYVVLSNIYTHSGRWADAGLIRKTMDIARLNKKPGCSWVEIKNRIHAFTAGDQSHPQYDSMQSLWNNLHERMKKMGYVPDKNWVLFEVEEEEKESFLNSHSERMAITFALLNTVPGIEIQIVKNLRVCGDCHAIIKLVSKITERRIIVRDSSRFHHFDSGTCSCKDYW